MSLFARVWETQLLLNEVQEKLSEAKRNVLETEQKLMEYILIAKEAEQKANDPFLAQQIVSQSFQLAEEWRQQNVLRLYYNVTQEELQKAFRWKNYADPWNPSRSCSSTQLNEAEFNKIHSVLQKIKSKTDDWNVDMRREYLILHTYHHMGLAGEMLGLSETSYIVEEGPSFSSIDNPLLYSSSLEARNFAALWSLLKLDLINVKRSSQPIHLETLNIQQLTDLQSSLFKDLDTDIGFRQHPATIASQKVILPLPEEVPFLVLEFLNWTQTEFSSLLHLVESPPSTMEQLHLILSFACEIHSHFVHIHPFSDGNGRVARTLSAIALQSFGLPSPMYSRHIRDGFMKAVSDHIIRFDASPIYQLQTKAILLSLDFQQTILS
jgi:hypothetical protein